MKHPVVYVWIRVTARQTDVPGLFIHYMYTDPNRFTLSHGPSGLAIANFDDKNVAYQFARQIGKLADWLDSEQSIGMWSKEVRAKIFKLIDKTPGAERGGRMINEPK